MIEITTPHREVRVSDFWSDKIMASNWLILIGPPIEINLGVKNLLLDSRLDFVNTTCVLLVNVIRQSRHHKCYYKLNIHEYLKKQ